MTVVLVTWTAIAADWDTDDSVPAGIAHGGPARGFEYETLVGAEGLETRVSSPWRRGDARSPRPCDVAQAGQ